MSTHRGRRVTPAVLAWRAGRSIAPNWLDGLFEQNATSGGPAGWVETLEGEMPVADGEWIVRLPDGRQTVLRDWLFRELWERDAPIPDGMGGLICSHTERCAFCSKAASLHTRGGEFRESFDVQLKRIGWRYATLMLGLRRQVVAVCNKCIDIYG